MKSLTSLKQTESVNKRTLIKLQGEDLVMVEFEYQPWKKIVVHEVVKLTLEHFLSTHSLGVKAGGIGRPLLWADDVIFDKGGFRDTDDIIREKLEGKVHWTALNYTVLEKHQPEFKVAGNIRIPVINVSDNKVFKEMAAWIKSNFEKTGKN